MTTNHKPWCASLYIRRGGTAAPCDCQQDSGPSGMLYDEGVATQVHGHWHVLLALAMHKMGLTELTVTSQDIAALQAAYGGAGNVDAGGPTVVLDARGSGTDGPLTLRLMTRRDALQFALRTKQD